MIFNIHKGHHRARPLYWLCWWPFTWNLPMIRRQVIFDFSAKYDLGNEDQQDVNKLFGLCFGRVHRNSARFGWRYNTDTQKFVLFSYCYLNGERIMQDLCEVVGNKRYECMILMNGKDYIFRVTDMDTQQILAMDSVSMGHKRKLGFLLGLFFGGNQKAPHNIKIEIKKL